MTLWKKLLRILLWVAGVIGTAVSVLVPCAALILAMPEEEDTPAVTQPLLSPSPAASVTEEGDLWDLVAGFPVPVMSFMSGSGMVFVSGVSSDTALEGGMARTLTLNWQTQDGLPVILQSIYPASALRLLEDPGFHFSSVRGPALFGSASVRMESADRIRLHAATDKGLYVVTVPRDPAPDLSMMARSLQLFTAEIIEYTE